MGILHAYGDPLNNNVPIYVGKGKGEPRISMLICVSVIITSDGAMLISNLHLRSLQSSRMKMTRTGSKQN